MKSIVCRGCGAKAIVIGGTSEYCASCLLKQHFKVEKVRFGFQCADCGIYQYELAVKKPVVCQSCLDVRKRHEKMVETGWMCPVCGRGCSPYVVICPCQKGLTPV